MFRPYSRTTPPLLHTVTPNQNATAPDNKDCYENVRYEKHDNAIMLQFGENKNKTTQTVEREERSDRTEFNIVR